MVNSIKQLFQFSNNDGSAMSEQYAMQCGLLHQIKSATPNFMLPQTTTFVENFNT